MSKSKELRDMFVTAQTKNRGSTVYFKLESEDRFMLTPQQILDAISDYMIIDPDGIWADRSGAPEDPNKLS